MRGLMRAWWLVAVSCLLVVAPVALAQVQPAPDGGKPSAAEAEMGKQAAEQIEKEFKVADDPVALERINRIIARVEPYTQRPAIEYQAKVLAEGGINAFSLPGGYIYITKPLLSAVESDDELAAVIAHEMAHVSLGHGMDLARREAKINNKAALAILAAVLAGKNVDPGDVVLLAGLVRNGLLSGYSQEAELQADANGVVYLEKAGYHAVAMLTVVEGLAQMEMEHPHEVVIFRTHPYPDARARATRRQLLAMGVPLNPRPVLSTLKTKSEAVEENGHTIGRVSLDDYVVFEPAVTADGLTPQERADKIAVELGRLLLDNLLMYEVSTAVRPDRALVLARGVPVVTVLPGDAEFHGATTAELAAKTEQAIRLALWHEAVRRAF